MAQPVLRVEDAPEDRVSYAGWRVAFAAAAGVCGASLVVVAFPLLIGPLGREFGWSREAVSIAFGVTAASAAAFAAPIGLLTDRIGSRLVATTSLGLVGILFASLTLLGPSLAQLYLNFALLGAAAVGSSPVAYSRSIATWFTSRRGLALAIVVAGGALGGVLHPLLVTALIDRFGWRTACLVMGVLVLMLGVPIVLRVVRDRPGAQSAVRAGSSWTEGLRSGRTWLLIAILLLATMVQNSVIVHLVVLLNDRGITSALAAFAMSAMACAAVFGRLASGWLIDRVFAASVAVVTMLLAAAGASLLSVAESFWVAVLAAMLIGFGTGGESDVVPFLLSRYFGLRSLSALYGVAWMAAAVGGAIGPILMGRAFDRTGSYRPALIALAMLAVAAATLATLLPRYHGVELPNGAANPNPGAPESRR